MTYYGGMMLAVHLSLFALSIGALLMALWVIAISRSPLYKRPMATFLVVYVCVMICDWLRVIPSVDFKSFWLFVMMGLSFLFAPCAVLLAQQISNAPVRLQKLDERLIIGGWIFLLPLAFAPYISPAQDHPYHPLFSLFVHTTMLLAVVVFLIQCALAMSRCLRFIKQRSTQNTRLYAQLDDPNIEALRILALAVISYVAICVVRVVYCAIFDDMYLVNVLIAAVQTLIAFAIASAVLLQLHAPYPADESLRETLFAQDNSTRQAKYENSGLTQQRFSQVKQKLLTTLDQEQVYLDPDLSLSQLCLLVEEPPHTVSQVISQSELGSFYTMVNQRRLEAAMQALTLSPEKGVLEIAYACGFNSKSAFNACFKKQTGQTPSQYRKSATQLITGQVNCRR